VPDNIRLSLVMEKSPVNAVAVLEASRPLATIDELIDRAKDLGRASKSSSTRTAYASDWRDFTGWCTAHALQSLPATPQTVALYVTDLGGRAAVATVCRRLVTISVTHKEGDLDSPTAHKLVREVLSGLKRTRGTAQRKKTALTSDLMKAVLLEVGADSLKAKRDRAILLVGLTGALRRSEIAALDVTDLRFQKEGVVVLIRRSKTDQVGVGAEVAMRANPVAGLCVVRALREWIATAGITEGPLFRTFALNGGGLHDRRIAGQDVARIVRRVTQRAGLEGDFAGHSLRAGFVTSAARQGVAEASIMNVSRHKSVAILRGYVRRANLFEGIPVLS